MNDKPARWRMLKMCESCPFQESGPGLVQRKALRRARWRSILSELRNGFAFYCHVTTRADDLDDEDDWVPDDQSLYCAGALAYQDKHNCTSNFTRVMRGLDARREARHKKGQTRAPAR